MAYDTGSPLGFFFGNDSSDPRVNQQLRQRIALAMMARERKFPKNVGEGLSAIGDALGDRGIMRSLEQADLAQQAVTPPAAPSETSEAPAAQKTAYAPTEDVSGASATPPIIAATPQAAVQPPPPLETAPSQPASMLAPQMPTGVQGVDATPLSQAMNPQPMLPPQARVPSPMEPVDPNQRNALDENIDPRFGRRRAIAGIESGGTRDPYATLGAVTRTGDRAYGKYQMMGANIPSWTQAALGRSLTPQQFLASRDAQDTTFDKTFGGYADKYGEEGAAKAWYAGEGGMNNPNATDQHGRLTVRGYGQDFVNRLNGGQASPRDAITAQLLARGGDDTAQAVPPGSPDQRLALNGTPSPNVVPDIRPAPPVPSGIRAAPPVQVAQADQQSYPPGYVPPPPGTPPGAPTIPMSKRELQLSQWLAANQGNPYAPAKVAAELGALQAARTQRQNEANELFKAQIVRDTAQAAERTKGQMDQAQREATVRETEAKARAAALIDPTEKNTVLGPDGVGRPLKIEGQDTNTPPNIKITEPQQKLLVFHGWAGMGNDQMKGNDQLLAHGLQQEMLGKVPFAGNALQNAEYRRARNAANNFVLAFMRDTSGAAYGAKEMYDHASALLPKIGDDAKTLSDKAAQRQNFVDSLYVGLGNARPMADYLDKKRGDIEQSKQRTIDIEMQGVPKVQGEVKTNKKTGAKRMWNGSNWVEM